MKNENTKIIEAANNLSLYACKGILKEVKDLGFIPAVEGYTFKLAGAFFNVPSRRIQNAFRSHLDMFRNDYTIVPGKEITPMGIDFKDMGVNYGYVVTLPNGNSVGVAYSRNTILTTRAMIKLSEFLKDESSIARSVSASVIESPKTTKTKSIHTRPRYTGKPCYALDKSGAIVGTYRSAKEASEKTDTPVCRVYSCCTGKCSSAKSTDGTRHRFAYLPR